MIASALSDSLSVAALAASIGGVFTLIGVAITARILRRDTRHEDDRTWRRTQDDQWKSEVSATLDRIVGDVGDVRERTAGLEAVVKFLVPWNSEGAGDGR